MWFKPFSLHVVVPLCGWEFTHYWGKNNPIDRNITLKRDVVNKLNKRKHKIYLLLVYLPGKYFVLNA